MEEEACEAPLVAARYLPSVPEFPLRFDPVLNFAPRGPDHAGVTPMTSAS